MDAGERDERSGAGGAGPVEVIGKGVCSFGAYDGVEAAELAARWELPAVVAMQTTSSTLDDAHELAGRGAPHGTLVLADRQTGARGRQGRSFTSAPGSGVWLTLVARNTDPRAVTVLAIRLGLAVAVALDGPAGERVGLKWPNDVYLRAGKLAGILVEARWQGGRPAWAAAGIGINVVPPREVATAAGLPGAPRRAELLDLLLPRLREAIGEEGALGPGELDAFAARDIAAGRQAIAPLAGTVLGVASDGALRVLTEDGERRAHAGSLVLDAPFVNRSQSGEGSDSPISSHPVPRD